MMKLKETFVFYENGEDRILLDSTGTFSGMIKCNETAGIIVKQLQKGATIDQTVDVLEEEYDAPRERLTQDALKFIEKLQSVGALDE